MANELAKKGTQGLMEALAKKSVKEMIAKAYPENADGFIVSLLEVVGSDNMLKQCNTTDIIREATRAAHLRLPISKALGYAYLVPYREKGVLKPQFQLGYKGLIQLALRSNKIKKLHTGKIYEGIDVVMDYLTGDITLKGEPTSKKVVGYIASFKLNEENGGFQKALYMTKEEIIEHAKKYSKSYNSQYSAWKTDFDAMAMKTVLKKLLSVYAPMSIAIEVTTKDNDEPIPTENDNDFSNENEVIEVGIEQEESLEESAEEEKRDPGF